MIYEALSDQPIYSYTRKQAIEDGVLADLSGNDAVRQHWKYPLAVTSTVWGVIENAIRDDDNDLTGIIHDISALAKLPICSGAGNNDTVHFTVKIGKETCDLKLHLGPGDDHEPVLTLMFADED